MTSSASSPAFFAPAKLDCFAFARNDVETARRTLAAGFVAAAAAALMPDPATHADMRLCHSRSGTVRGTAPPKLFRPFRNYPSLTAFLTFRIQHPVDEIVG